MPARRLRVTGLVQGVFFRASAQQKAVELGLIGWVRNADDGTVEIHAEGTPQAIRQLEDWCWKGPPQAKVTAVGSENVEEEGMKDFSSEKTF